MGDNEFSYLASALGETGFFTLVIKASFVMRGIITVGKLFIVDQSDYNTQQIFFDDNHEAIEVRDA